MGNSKKRIGLIILGIIIFSTISLTNQVNRTQAVDPFFTLVFKTYGGGFAPDYGNFLKQHCARIGINIDVIIQDWPTFVGELIAFRDFDICYARLSGGGSNPDFTGVYNENGSLNLFGYHTSMDWDEDKGTGLNEWYMRQGTLIMPPTSEERIHHYWAWEQYLMDKILPLVPIFTPKDYVTYWSDLNGYEYSEGLLQSWGKMDWFSNHFGQESTDELVVADTIWDNLNPLFQSDSASSFISSACMDPLIWFDADQNAWPHLATSFTMINDTWMRITIRQRVKWDTDPEGNFTNEYLDVEDVYFTLYSLKHLSNRKEMYAWIKYMEIIDQWTIDIFIDGDPSTPENNPYAPFLSSLNTLILPEHYLNQAQLNDGITPDITHPSWETFSKNCFGTGFLKISNFKEGVETTLVVNQNSWRFDPVITADQALNWAERFGFGAGWWGIQQLRVRIIPVVQSQLIEFENGKLDLIDITWCPDKRNKYQSDINFRVQTDLQFSFGFFGFNMREVRPVIGSRTAAPGDPTISVGLCVRKVIAYAIDRFEMNDVIHGGEYGWIDTPIHRTLGVWCNPNIIRYNHDMDKAREYMGKAGFGGYYHYHGYDYFGLRDLFFYIFILGVLPITLIVSFVKSIKHIRNLKKNNFWPFRKRSSVRIISIQEQGYSWKYEVGQ